jgi:hypothetical protein
MFLLLFRVNNVYFDLGSSSIEHLQSFVGNGQMEKICICRDSDYELVWKNDRYTHDIAKYLLYKHLNEKINGPDTIKWDNWKF